MRLVLLIVLLAVLAGLAWIRLAPSDPARWHVDPRASDPPGPAGWKIGAGRADAPAPVWAATPEALLAAVTEIAAQTPRTTLLAGSPEEGRMTFVTRTRVIGFPDYTTVAADPAEGGAALTALARLRFGGSDLGVNRARIEDWVARLDARLDRLPAT